MIHRILIAAVCAATLSPFTLSAQVPCGINLLQNPGCEQGIAGWVDPAGTWSCQTGPNPGNTTPPPHRGGFYFFAGVSKAAELHQDIDLTPYPVGQQFELSGYVSAAHQHTLPADFSQLELQCLDVTGATLSTSASTPVSSILLWSLQDTGITAPAGATTLRVVLRATRNQGLNNDGYFDDLYLVALPVSGTGEANGAGASLMIDGVGPAGSGPFYRSVENGTGFSATISGAPSAPFALLLGVLEPCSSVLGCSGCLDLTGFATLLAGGTDGLGTFSVNVPIPAGLDGLGFGLQAAVGSAPGSACPFELSASFCIAIQ